MSSTLKMPRPPNTFPTGNKLLQKKWDQRAYRLHVQKMRSMKAGLDNREPHSYVHLQLRLKKIQAEEERQATIEHENRILLAKLTQILRSHGVTDNWNIEHEPRSLNRPHMERQLQKIEQENQDLMRRIGKVSSTYKTNKWEDDYILHQYYMQMRANDTKDYELYATREDIYESEAEDDDGKESGGEDSQNEDETKTEAGSEQKKTKSKPPLKKQQSRFPLLGTQRVKEEQRKKREESLTKGQKYDEKGDAAMLFKATKGMGNAPSAVTRALARRKYKQRQGTKSRFELQYELDLMEELKGKLGDAWDDMLQALLMEREEYDAMCINHALLGIGTIEATLIEILCTRNNAALSAIKTAYSERYEKELTDDIKSNITDTAFQGLLLTLVKGIRDEGGAVDQNQAEEDAKELLETEEQDRWNTQSGKFSEILTDCSFAQLRAVIDEYAKMTGKTVTDVLMDDFDGQLQDAMLALIKCIANCPGFLTSRVRESLTGAGDGTTLVRIIMTRSEVDLPQIKKIYKKRYSHTLEDDLESKCKEKYKKSLIEAVKVSGFTPKKTEQNPGIKKQGTVKMKPPIKWRPLKRPPVKNPKATVAADNPIMKTLKDKQGAKPKSAQKRVTKEQTPDTRETSETGSYSYKED
ncbi:uncharacterized protein LOC144453250 [Glandiceps talaboti]